jgi:hypothetical protein
VDAQQFDESLDSYRFEQNLERIENRDRNSTKMMRINTDYSRGYTVTEIERVNTFD